MTSATRLRRKREGQKPKPYDEPTPSTFNAVLTSNDHVYIRGTVGGEQIDVSFRVPTIAEVHQRFNNPRRKIKTCVHGPFLLFRTFFSARMSEYTAAVKKRGKISKMSKEIWDNAGKEIKDRFSKLAKEANDQFRNEVPLIWVDGASGNNSNQADHNDNSEANVVRDVVASTTVSTMTTPTESVSDLAFPENQPTNDLGYELIPTELQDGVYFAADVNTLQQDAYEQYVAEPVVQNTPGPYYYMSETQQVMDYSVPLYYDYVVDNYYDWNIYWSYWNEYARKIDEYACRLDEQHNF